MNTAEITNVIPQIQCTIIAEPGAARTSSNRSLLEQRLRFALYGVTVLLMAWLTVSVLTSITDFESTLDAIRVQLAAPSFNL